MLWHSAAVVAASTVQDAVLYKIMKVHDVHKCRATVTAAD